MEEKGRKKEGRKKDFFYSFAGLEQAVPVKNSKK